MLSIVGFGTLSLLVPQSARARWALRTFLETKPYQWAHGGVWVASRLLATILDAVGPQVRNVEYFDGETGVIYHAQTPSDSCVAGQTREAKSGGRPISGVRIPAALGYNALS